MTEDEFQQHLDRLGGDLEGWPPAVAAAARALLARSPGAQARLDEMVAMELALADAGAGDTPSDDLADRIFDAAFGAGRGSASHREDRDGDTGTAADRLN